MEWRTELREVYVQNPDAHRLHKNTRNVHTLIKHRFLTILMSFGCGPVTNINHRLAGPHTISPYLILSPPDCCVKKVNVKATVLTRTQITRWLTGNSQVRPLQRWKTAARPSRLQSRNRPIFLFLSLPNFDLKPFTDFADAVTWSSMFQRLTTLSEKKWRRTSQLHRCLTSLNEWPRVLLSVFNSKNLPSWRLRWDLSDFFFLQASIDLVYLGAPCQFLHSRIEWVW